MMNKFEKKIVIEGEFESVVQIEKHFYLIDKVDKVCVLPYTISSEGLLDKIGVIRDWNFLEEESLLTLIWGYLSTDDPTNLVSANRILFEITGVNITEAVRWMYLGTLYNNMSSDSPIRLYAVDITDIPIKTVEEVEEEENRREFKMMNSSTVIQTDDMMFLASYLRLFNYFYINSLEK
jgi:hypothetical protein